jgi:hypothetical protein
MEVVCSRLAAFLQILPIIDLLSLWNTPSKKAVLRDDFLHRSGLYGHHSALFVPLRPLI